MKHPFTKAERHYRIDLMFPAEKAIHDAVCEIEKLPADIRLTQAQTLLAQAKALVSDYLDELADDSPIGTL